MLRLSYFIKLLLLLLGLVVVLEIVSYVATRLVIREAVTENARRELMRGGEVFAQLMQSRAEQLALSVNVLTDDFGFKEAVASDDAETIRSALVNHSARVKADIGVFINRRGELIGTTGMHDSHRMLLGELQRELMRTGKTSAVIMINDKPYQFVMSSVRAPVLIGLAGMGFEVDKSLTESLKHLTALDVSFISVEDSSMQYLSGTLDASARQNLLTTLMQRMPEDHQVLDVNGMMTLLVPVAQQPHRVAAVLQIPLTRILQPFASLNSQLLWLALFFSLFAAVVAWFLARNVTRPVRTLADSARRIGAGSYNTPVPVKSHDEFGELASAFIAMQQAISVREQKILHQAEHDSLTALANRSRAVPELQKAIARATETTQAFCVMLIDIQNFTQINDELTQEIGDQVLIDVAHRVATVSEVNCSALRWGSDEFLLIVDGMDSASASSFAERLHQQFTEPVQLNELHVKVALNIGIASYPVDATTPDTLLRRVSLALNNGRINKQRSCHYQIGWDENHLRRITLLREFQPALHTQQISLYFQPKIHLLHPQSLGAEALIRWNHPQLGFINPEEFIAVIESAGQITLLTRWVLKTAIAYLAELRRANISLTLSVNLSALDLLVDNLHEYIRTLLQEYSIEPHSLCLEITESVIMREADRSLRNLNNLQDLGLALSIDDFGTGYSSLSQLKKLPVSELKIDKSFILNLDASADDQLIVRSTIELGHTMGLSVTAEGVETQAIETLLRQFQCDTVQGYLYSRPLAADAFSTWIKDYQGGLKQ
jgi:diguanylate cyclase (GGDEF)-like protein